MQACNKCNLGRKPKVPGTEGYSQAGGPETAGTTIGWPSGSRGEWDSGSAGSRATVCRVARFFGSPPWGLAFILPSFADTAGGRSRSRTREAFEADFTHHGAFCGKISEMAGRPEAGNVLDLARSEDAV